jgi:phosphatidylserine/phosphatidylglycerophosphate/cardiolipin synthase-like enzyme
VIEERTLVDGGQTAEAIAAALVAWLDAARHSLDVALYDVRLPGAVGDVVADSIRAAAARGVAVRIAFNEDGDRTVKPLPPPPRTEPSLLEQLGVPLRAIPGDPDLMHHKYVVRDGGAVWTGSTNWTLDSWTREENVLLTVASEGVACGLGGSRAPARPPLRRPLEPRAGRGQRQLRHRAGGRRGSGGPRVVLAGARAGALSSHRQADRRG